ncbi:M61 family metallopeptidase [Lichenicola sp.]|uniref:M61 family metallopeptidase n=1 Tax=Lichenicola sp. TaxID=2804529 RepID=UPI003B005327
MPAVLGVAVLFLGNAAIAADPAQPQPAPPVAPIPTPQDVAYPGSIALQINATDLDRHIFTGHETVPVPQALAANGGDLVLLFPKWLPGDHSATGELDKFASLVIHSDGTQVAWTRDTVDVYAFHVPVPRGATSLDLDFQFLSPTAESQGRVVMTSAMLSLQWNNMLLYPAGYFSRGITVDASVTLPDGWKFGSGLDVASTAGAVTHFKPTPLNTLVDNPMLAGKYFRREDLNPNPGANSGPPVYLDIVADRPEDLAITPEELAFHRALITQASRLYQSHHYAHYDFLLSLSDELGEIGLEHHSSSEDGVGQDYFTEWDKGVADHDLLPHEYTHSWNGKFRRPADLWQPNFNTPERDSLLWVYEGQTEYWGKVLAARSGLSPRQDSLDGLAYMAAVYSNGVGRSWRDLEDTTNDPVIATRRPIPWSTWQRSEDYYDEGVLVWLDIDTKIRELSHGTKSLDDFAHAFFGIDDGSIITQTYVFDDVVKTLNGVVPFDWAGLLKARLYATGGNAPLDGFSRGGYQLVYTDTETPFIKSVEAVRKMADFSFSLGVALKDDGTVRHVIWGSPAFKAGIVVGTQIVAVDGLAYDVDQFKQTLKESPSNQNALQLLLKADNHYRTVSVDYHGGLRYPHLQRTGSTPATLDAILAAKPGP